MLFQACLDSVRSLVQTAVKGNVTLAVRARVHNILAGLDTEWDEAAEECEADHGESRAAQVCAGTYFKIKKKRSALHVLCSRAWSGILSDSIAQVNIPFSGVVAVTILQLQCWQMTTSGLVLSDSTWMGLCVVGSGAPP